MPDFTFTSPEGQKYTVTGPDGATQEQAFTMLQAQIAQGAKAARAPASAPAAPPKPLGWSDVPLQAVKNLPQSTGNFIGGIAQAVRHPIDTVSNVVDIGAGALRNALPSGLVSTIDGIDAKLNPQAKANQARMTEKAGAAGQFFKDRYGSVDGVKNTLANDPVGAASDVATVLTGGAGLAKLGARGMTAAASAAGRSTPGISSALNTAGQVLGKAGDAVNPVNVARVAAVKALPKIGDAAAAVVGNLGTHTGAESIKTAFQSGMRGGKAAETFADNMRGNVPMTDVLSTAKANLDTMGRQKAAAYRQGMAQVSGDTTVLNFADIDQALHDASQIGTYKGKVVNERAATDFQKIADTVAEWKAENPADFHTPEGLDALKKRIGGIVDSTPFEEKTARHMGDTVYNAVKDTIVRQAPVYADTMKAYSDATEQIREIERTLSLGKKASVDTAMRKLQSLTRNNVNTNYGNRLNLADQLVTQGGRELMPALAGQALSSWTPRGLGGALAAPSGLAGYSMGGPIGAAGVLAVQSPRLMGEAVLASGKVAGKVKKASELPRRALARSPVAGADAANLLYQLGRLP